MAASVVMCACVSPRSKSFYKDDFLSSRVSDRALKAAGPLPAKKGRPSLSGLAERVDKLLRNT